MMAKSRFDPPRINGLSTKQKLIQGTLDVPLNAEGEMPKSNASDRGPSPPLPRCRSTRFREANRPCKPPRRLRKLFDLKCRKAGSHAAISTTGLWQGMAIDEIRRVRQPKVYRQWQDAPECVCPPQGETLEVGRRPRPIPPWRRLTKRHKNGVDRSGRAGTPRQPGPALFHPR